MQKGTVKVDTTFMTMTSPAFDAANLLSWHYH